MSEQSLPAFDKLWNYGDPAGTEFKFNEILVKPEVLESPAYMAELLTQIARCQGLQDKFDLADATLDRVERMLQPEMDRARVRYFLERGRVFNSSGQPQKALPLFEQAYALGQSANETRLAFDALHMIAIAQPDLQAKVEWNLRGIAAVKETPSQLGWLPAFLNNLGEACASLLDYEQALHAFQELAALDVSRGRSPDIHTQKDIAKMLRKLGRFDEAMATIRPVFEDLESKNQADGWIDEEMAECLLAMRKTVESKPLFARAHEALKSDRWVLQHEPSKLERLKQMAEE